MKSTAILAHTLVLSYALNAHAEDVEDFENLDKKFVNGAWRAIDLDFVQIQLLAENLLIVNLSHSVKKPKTVKIFLLDVTNFTLNSKCKMNYYLVSVF